MTTGKLYDVMTLRDWYAGKYKIEVSNLWAKTVMGRNPPQSGDGNDIECIKYWLEAESKIRFMHADAMLKARGE